MKQVIVLLLAVTAMITGSVIVSGLLSQEDTTAPSQSSASLQSDTTVAENPSTVNTSYTVEEVMKRNTKDNCWLIINNSVYNVTEYIDRHPGGASRITDFCGKDATQAFQTQGGEGQHSSSASSQLNEYIIGSIQ
jgi:cytochrome b involved in lipid metabolism